MIKLLPKTTFLRLHKSPEPTLAVLIDFTDVSYTTNILINQLMIHRMRRKSMCGFIVGIIKITTIILFGQQDLKIS